MTFKVIVDQETCIGCGACTACDNFELTEGKSHPKQELVEEVGCNKSAEENCPVDAIKVEEV